MDKKSTILLILIIAVSVICRVTIDMDENSAGQLTLFIIACFLVLPFAISPKLQKNKKGIVVFGILIIAMFCSYSMITAVRDNPKLIASLNSSSIEFKEDETLPYDQVGKIEYYEDVQIKIAANGYRWGNDDYYSGDANVDFMDSDENTIRSINQCK